MPTEQEWLKAFGEASCSTQDGSGCTVAELSRLSGRSDKWVRNWLREQLRDGRIELSRKRGNRIDGVLCWFPCYTLKAVESEVKVAKSKVRDRS